jgi:protein disulfide-isomerase
MKRLLVLSCAVLLAASACSTRRSAQPSTAAPSGWCPAESGPSGRAPDSRPFPAFSQTNTPFDEMTRQAAATHHPAILYFCAHWCGYCVKMNSETLSQGRVASRIGRFPSSRYDPDTPAGRDVAQRFGVNGFPTMVLVDGSGNEVDRIVGFRPADELLGLLARW